MVVVPLDTDIAVRAMIYVLSSNYLASFAVLFQAFKCLLVLNVLCAAGNPRVFRCHPDIAQKLIETDQAGDELSLPVSCWDDMHHHCYADARQEGPSANEKRPMGAYRVFRLPVHKLAANVVAQVSFEVPLAFIHLHVFSLYIRFYTVISLNVLVLVCFLYLYLMRFILISVVFEF